MTARTAQKNIRISCEPQNLKRVRKDIEDLCRNCGMADRLASLLVLSVDEAVSSILWHASDTNRTGEIRISADVNETRFQAVIEDYSNGFEPRETSKMSEKEVDEFLEREKKHRMGIFVIRRIMDEVTYSYKRGYQNELILVKFL